MYWKRIFGRAQKLFAWLPNADSGPRVLCVAAFAFLVLQLGWTYSIKAGLHVG